ncbi:MAG TPA: hypothetical protein VEP30_00920 [Chthoniobacterales bacterium]|nr:hypothetical protein [Chthoniobacterales bacterium]
MNKQGFFKAVLGQTSYTLVVHGLGALLAWLISLGVIASLAPHWQALQEYRWLAIGMLTVAILIIAIKIYLANVRKIPVFPKVDFDFLVLDKEISIRFHSLEDIVYRKKMKLKALHNDLGHFTDKYNWTGSGNVRVRSQHDEHRLQLTNRGAVFQWYETHFDRVLKKGETIDIETVWNIEDKSNTATPFISTTIEEPTASLTMRVFGNEFFGIRQATCEHKATMGTHKPYDSDTLQANGGEVIWDIPHPKLYHYYEMRWTPHYQRH